MTPVGIYHLVRHANGIAPFLTFVRSLRRWLPTRPWTLILIFKGFDDRREAEPYLAETRGLPIATVFVSDAGTDIGAYFKAAEATDFEIVGFFNSFCEIVAPRWFEMFVDQLGAPGVGLVGATGSLESVVHDHVVYGRAVEGLVAKGRKYALAAGLLALYPPFPNAHVRTNAFMLRRADFMASRKFPVGHRLAALYYESGWWSLTRQIQSRGLAVRIVDRDGQGLAPEAWAHAATFRSGAQDRVVVRDNRVREYENADEPRKQLLRRLAFGDDA